MEIVESSVINLLGQPFKAMSKFLFWKNCKLGVPIDLYWFELGHSCEFLLGQSCCWGWMGEVCIGNVTGICWINGKGPGHGPAVSESQFDFQWEKGYFFPMASCSHQVRNSEWLTWCF